MYIDSEIFQYQCPCEWLLSQIFRIFRSALKFFAHIVRDRSLVGISIRSYGSYSGAFNVGGRRYLLRNNRSEESPGHVNRCSWNGTFQSR